MMNAVPFLPGANGLVVPCGKVMTQLFFNARVILRVSLASNPFLSSVPSGLHVRLTVIAPARPNNLLIQPSFIVSAAATYFTLVKGQSRYQGTPSLFLRPQLTAQKM